ncbi:hypothetical protein L3X38_017190 [Prunus dulcis]|uniref:Uncharacterized protein n=1 Tax=Prunus dulcis TaxID=3755 RepID=A0AAD4W6V3_PRUDU|nr:hypothetical protein L3X38_017190 [Prunus dulcis]
MFSDGGSSEAIRTSSSKFSFVSPPNRSSKLMGIWVSIDFSSKRFDFRLEVWLNPWDWSKYRGDSAEISAEV